MKKGILLFQCLAFASFCFGQSLSREVVGIAGDVFTISSGSLEWTLGEIMTETFALNGSVLTQGFHQPETTIERELGGYAAYPNPVPDYLTVRIVKKGSYLVEIFNLHGQKLIDKTLSLHPDNATFQIDMHNFDSALYILRILNTDSNESISFKIEKK